VTTILMISRESTAQISSDWYDAAIPNFRLVWRPPFLPAIPLPAPLMILVVRFTATQNKAVYCSNKSL